ncbi:MAG TPA: transferrin receptor-like dimerization domain-containing protein [Vicinamibacterales bacterium]
MRRYLPLLALVLIALVPRPAAQAPAWEDQFRALPEPANIRESMRRMSARPHHAGSPYGRDNAEWIAARFREWGWETAIEEFQVLIPTPKERRVELLEPRRVRLKLDEPAIPEDPTSSQKDEQLPGYNAYSADGDVTGPLVYVNYGRPEDYEVLDRMGISVKGAIVIARYGASWRGIKPKVAAERGAIGCLIYSDPRDDGYFDGPVYPEGPMRNRDGVQRGSVMDMPIHPGDPLTPGRGATKDAERLPRERARTLMSIPVLPISWGDAQPLLEAIDGPLAPPEWRGALPLPYRIGPGPAKVRLTLSFNWDLAPAYNVVARLRGSRYPDEWIIRGNHHDAWVNGAEDPASGMAVLLEEARALGELRRRGWTPKRTIVYIGWDAEEQGLIGSTEWVEAHREELERHAVAYINTDGYGRGFLEAGGSHSLERFINEVARAVDDLETGVSVWKKLQARRITTGSKEARDEARTRADLRIAALGSGSDYTPFLQHAGIASLNLGFGGADDAGIYHSVYDSFAHYTRFQDTEFVYGRALAQVVGTAVLRLADADRLPFEFTNLADTVQKYVTELQTLLRTKQDEARERNRQIDEGVFAAMHDPRRPLRAPERLPVPPAINFAPLENAAAALSASAAAYAKAVATATPTPETLQRVNALLIRAERQLSDPEGLPRRPWYRHLLYAPGLYTGYGVKTVPGVREAIEQRQYDQAEREIVRAAAAIQRLARLLDEAVAELER